MDPSETTVYRCQYCNGTVLFKDIQEFGGCKCGSRKVRVAFALTEAEVDDLKARGYDFKEEAFSKDREDAWTNE